MFCDAIDVIFKDDPQRVVDIFESFNCDALFMSTTSPEGYNCMSEVKNSVDKINGGNGRYLNSGTYIGKTEFIKSFLIFASFAFFPVAELFNPILESSVLITSFSFSRGVTSASFSF